MNMLTIHNLTVNIGDKEILKGVNLSVQAGKIHVLMGQNGSGKSTLAQTLMGSPLMEITGGNVSFEATDLLKMAPDERALAGLFLSFQYPSEVTGVPIANFLRLVYNKCHEKKLNPVKFRSLLKEKMAFLEMNEDFMHRYLNDGFSGGEKKRMEMLQMLILEPKLAILDETDSGLDIDALQVVAKAVNYLHEENDMSVLLITHYTRILDHIKADYVHIMKDGQITKEGDHALAYELEKKGYAQIS